VRVAPLGRAASRDDARDAAFELPKLEGKTVNELDSVWCAALSSGASNPYRDVIPRRRRGA